jgi:HAD superfamily hydrolase (TIGR01509 family)
MLVAVGPLADIPLDRCLAVGDGRAVVARVGEEVVAFENRCLHQDSPLAGGQIRQGTLTCPLHFWRYRLPSGVHVGGEGRLTAYPVTVVDGVVHVEVPEATNLSFRERMLAHAAAWDRDAAPRSPVEVVVWDMGGVFHRYFTEVLVDIGKERGWPLERMPLGPTGIADDPDYRRMMRGEISEPEYLEGIRRLLAAEGIGLDPVADPDYQREARPEVWELIAAIAESGRRQAILTNDASRWMGERWWETWPQRHLFDAIVDVATLAERKPAPGPYRAVLGRLGDPPERCLFVDDMPVNCRGAERVGMQSLWFDITASEASVRRLRQRMGVT